MKYVSFFVCVLLSSCTGTKTETRHETVSSVMDAVIARVYEQVPAEKYDSIDDDFMLNFLTADEKHILATRYQYFTVNVPVVVSVMRHQEQETVPFWLQDSGFL